LFFEQAFRLKEDIAIFLFVATGAPHRRVATAENRNSEDCDMIFRFPVNGIK
jgi:hypothetical protein